MEPTGEGRFLANVYALQFYSPMPPTDTSLRSVSGRPGRIGSVKTWLWQVGLIPSYQTITLTLYTNHVPLTLTADNVYINIRKVIYKLIIS